VPLEKPVQFVEKMEVTSVHGYGLSCTPIVISRDLDTREICGDQGETEFN